MEEQKLGSSPALVRVWHRNDPDVPLDAKYVGRPTDFGNPYKIGRDGDRETVIQMYRDYFPLSEADLKELRGHDLVCWCAPRGGITINDPIICHAQVILEMISKLETA